MASFPHSVAVLTVLMGGLAIVSAQGTSVASLPSDAAVPTDQAVTIGTLPNGLRYYIRANPLPDKRAALRLVVNAGSVLEDDDQRGLGHFVEHLAFAGTKHFPNHRVMPFLGLLGSNLGPDANATTGFDETIYTIDVRSDAASLDGALLVLEDWAQSITFNSGAIDDERPVILEEWRQRLGVSARLRDKQMPVVLQGSRYADRLPIGTPGTIRMFNTNRLRQFYADWYRPDLMAVVAVGDFDVAQVARMVDAHFAGMPARRDAPVRPAFDVPSHPGTRFVGTTDPESPRTTFTLTTRLPSRDSRTVDGYRQVVADRLVNTLLNARLSEAASRQNSSLLRVNVARRPFVARGYDEAVVASVLRDTTVDEGMESLIREVERVKRFGFTPVEIERQRQNVLRAADRLVAEASSRDSGARADEYVRHFLRGDAIPSIEDQAALYRRFVPEVPGADLNALAREWLSDRNRIAEVVAPESTRATLPDEARFAAIAGRVGVSLLTPYAEIAPGTALLSAVPSPGVLVSETRRGEFDLTEWHFANGVRVVVKPTPVRADEVLFRASRLGGTSTVGDEEFSKVSGAAQLANASGVGTFSGVDLRKVLTGRIATAAPFINELEEGLGGSSSPKDLEALFQLIFLRFTQPRRDPLAFSILKAQLTSTLLNQTASPDLVLRGTLTNILTSDHPRRHPYDAAALDRWDLDASVAFYRRRFANANGFTFVFVGNVTPEALLPLAQRYLGSLPSTGDVSTYRDLGVRPPVGTVERTVVKGLEPKSQVAISFNGPFPYSETSRLELRAVALLLQSRLSAVIREELGGTYSIVVSQSVQPAPLPMYDLRIQWSCAPQRVEALTRRVFDEIRKLKEALFSELTVRSLREALEREIQESLRQNTYITAQLALKYELGEDPTEIWTYPARLDALDAAAIRSAAATYLDVTRYAKVTLQPEILQTGSR